MRAFLVKARIIQITSYFFVLQLDRVCIFSALVDMDNP